MSTAYHFGNFKLQPGQRRLLRDGHSVELGARAFDVLLALAERPGELVTKAELLDRAWPGLVVEENNLQVQISTLRKLLGPQVIATIPGRGYRFAAAPNDETTPSQDNSASAPISKATKFDAPASTRTNLPGELPALYGRDEDVQALCSLTASQRLVTVVGAGGIGKSRLAQAAAHKVANRWSDGAWMVELAGLSDPVFLPNTVAQILGIKIANQAEALDELVAGMAQRTLLLILDNCEHLLDACAALVQTALLGSPNITVLATSQEPLHLATEQQFRILPLAVPNEVAALDAREFGAVALFEARVRAANPGFTLSNESLALVIDICRRLDGLPLAIELAAARVVTLGLRPVRDKLDARFKLLTAGSRASLRRHQTLRAALEWSHNLLDETERAVFRRLAVFAGGFTMEMAQGVAGDAKIDDWAVLDQLSALVVKSLVVADSAVTPRYRLLESARAFALEQLATDETSDTLRRHAQAMLAFLQRVDDANLDGDLRTDQYAALVVPELDNLRAAHAWAKSEAGDLSIAIALAAHAGSLIDYAVECVDWLVPMQEFVEADRVAPAVAARYWRALAANNMVGRVLRTLQAEAADRALSMYRADGAPRRVFSSLIQIARHRIAQHDEAAAHSAVAEARQLIRADWPAEFHILLLRADASLAGLAGRHADEVAIRREAVRLSMSSGDWRQEVMDRSNLVDTLWAVGSLEDAAHEARKLAAELRVRPAADNETAVLFSNLIGVLCELGHIDEASVAACEAIPVLRRAKYTYIPEWVYFYWRRGQIDTATILLGACDEERVRFGTPHQVNEGRLIDEARAALAAHQDAETFSKYLAAGAALDENEWLPLISEALTQSHRNN